MYKPVVGSNPGETNPKDRAKRVMARKKDSEEDILCFLREIEVNLHGAMDVVSACRTAGISDKTYTASVNDMAALGTRS